MNRRNLREMSTQELQDEKTRIKGEIEVLHQEAKAVDNIYREHIEDEHTQRAIDSMTTWANANGMTFQEAVDYWRGRLTDNGDPGRWLQSNIISGRGRKVSR